jgi:hypothetical protein
MKKDPGKTLREIIGHALRQHPELRMVAAPARDERALLTFLADLSPGLGQRFHVIHRAAAHDPLAALCDLHGSDKGSLRQDGHPYPWPPHTYTDVYGRLFGHCRSAVTRVFECGLGTNNPDLPSTMGASGRPGASLRVWRDYFPNAQIFGADVDTDILFEEERIRTFHVDQCDPAAIRAMWERIGETGFDLMIDDGLHTFEAGSILFQHAIDRLAPSGIYVIEDVIPADLIRYRTFFDATGYQVDYVVMQRPGLALSDNNLVVIRKSQAA